MPIDPEQVRYFQQFSRRRVRPMNTWQKLLAGVAGAGIFVLALMFSVVLFAVVATVGLAVWGWVWWKTRDLRKQMREQMERQRQGQGASAEPGAEGLVIEGEILREGEVEDMPGDGRQRRPDQD